MQAINVQGFAPVEREWINLKQFEGEQEAWIYAGKLARAFTVPTRVVDTLAGNVTMVCNAGMLPNDVNPLDY